MEQPLTPNSTPQKPTKTKSTDPNALKRKLPTPQELISHYESKGLDTQEASLKVIGDLQSALFRVISSGRGRKDKLLAETSRKADSTNNSLAILNMKLDSKPAYGESFAIGVASGLTVQGIGSVLLMFSKVLVISGILSGMSIRNILEWVCVIPYFFNVGICSFTSLFWGVIRDT